LDKRDIIISNWLTDLYEQQETQTEDVDFLLSLIGSKAKKVLEIACGSGRILVPLARAGHHVNGLDVDEAMLDKISNKAEGLTNISWKKVDVISDKWDTDFDVVVIAGNLLFNLVTDMDYKKAQKLLITKASQSLVAGGFVYIDYGYTLHPENWFNYSDEHVVFEGTDCNGNTGKMSICNSSYSLESGLVKFLRKYKIYTANGIVEKEIESIKHYATLEQIHKWLVMAGFKIEEEYGDYYYNPIGENTNRAIIKAIKL
jgi:SAM-dependent methyltransferase